MFKVSQVMWLFLLVAPVASAQSAGAGAPVPGPAPAAPIVPQPEQKLTISGPQMLEQGQEYRKEIEAIRQQIQTQVQQAKSDQDVIRLNCVLDKLTQVNVNANIMDQSLQILRESITRRDENGQLHQYTRITIVYQKVQVLKTEADACVGAETNYVGPTKVVVEVPAGLNDDVDQQSPPAPPVSIVERPPPSSPFQ